MQFIDIDTYIRGENFQFERELKHLSRAQLAQILCCSVLQIQQIEEGGKSSYYTESQKLKTARRLAHFLGMSEEKAFMGPSEEGSSIPKQESMEHNKKQVIQKTRLTSKIGFAMLMLILGGSILYEIFLTDRNLYELTLVKSSHLNEAKLTPQKSEDLIVSTPTDNPCNIDVRASSTFKADTPNLDGNFVIFQSAQHHKICLIDGSGESQIVEIIPGLKKMISGKGPFQVLGHHLNDIEMYYQGLRVSNLTPNLNRVDLLEAPYQNRITSMNNGPTSQPINSINSSVQQNNDRLSLAKSSLDNEQVLGLNSVLETDSLLSSPTSSKE